jgi:hypothetical protein
MPLMHSVRAVEARLRPKEMGTRRPEEIEWAVHTPGRASHHPFYWNEPGAIISATTATQEGSDSEVCGDLGRGPSRFHHIDNRYHAAGKRTDAAAHPLAGGR